MELYRELRRKHGRPLGQWSLWCKRPKTKREKEEVIIGAILTQRTNWKNVELAMMNLRKAKAASLKKIYFLGRKNPRKLANLIKPSGFYKTKARYLFDIARFFVKNGGIAAISRMSLGDLRLALCRIPGVGQETADSILLYALQKPVFVIDEYTRRLLSAKGLAQIAKTSHYEKLQELFEKNLRRDWRLYQDFHALIVIDGKVMK